MIERHLFAPPRKLTSNLKTRPPLVFPTKLMIGFEYGGNPELRVGGKVGSTRVTGEGVVVVGGRSLGRVVGTGDDLAVGNALGLRLGAAVLKADSTALGLADRSAVGTADTLADGKTLG